MLGQSLVGLGLVVRLSLGHDWVRLCYIMLRMLQVGLGSDKVRLGSLGLGRFRLGYI